eukprot:8314747-Karenia_brevis.AAC.1
MQSQTLLGEISTIADDPAPACIWRKHGRTAQLFKFLADRFLGAPDSVGEAESIHAIWQRLENNRSRMKLPLLNAVLKLRTYHEHYGELPSYEELLPYINDVEDAFTMMYAHARDIANDNSLWRDSPFLERFNISSDNVAILQGAHPEARHDAVTGGSAEIAWGNYVRFLFQKHNVYSLTRNGITKYIYIAENKSVAYRDGPAEGDAMGRAISMIFLEQIEDEHDVDEYLDNHEHVFQPITEDGSIQIVDMSIADISLHMGVYPLHATHDKSERDIEVLHEDMFLDMNPHRLESRRLVTGATTSWKFILDVASGIAIEEWVQGVLDLGDHTKMALARRLQVRDGLTSAARNRVWQLPRQALLAAITEGGDPVAGGPAAGGAAPAAAAPGPGGKGRGRGRGGRARGGRRGRRGGGAVAPPMPPPA